MARSWAGERPEHPTRLRGGGERGRARPLSPPRLNLILREGKLFSCLFLSILLVLLTGSKLYPL